MNSTERRKVENMLISMGLKGLRDPALIEQLANLIDCWHGDRHDFLMGLLNECDTAEQRAEMYQAIRPKLKFRVLPLSTYEDRIRMAAGAAISRRQMRVEGDAPKPIEVGGKKYMEVSPELASIAMAVVTLKCHKCRDEEKFIDNTPVGAMTQGRSAGWRRDPSVNKEMCPDCVAKHLISLSVQ